MSRTGIPACPERAFVNFGVENVRPALANPAPFELEVPLPGWTSGRLEHDVVQVEWANSHGKIQPEDAALCLGLKNHAHRLPIAARDLVGE